MMCVGVHFPTHMFLPVCMNGVIKWIIKQTCCLKIVDATCRHWLALGIYLSMSLGGCASASRPSHSISFHPHLDKCHELFLFYFCRSMLSFCCLGDSKSIAHRPVHSQWEGSVPVGVITGGGSSGGGGGGRRVGGREGGRDYEPPELWLAPTGNEVPLRFSFLSFFCGFSEGGEEGGRCVRGRAERTPPRIKSPARLRGDAQTVSRFQKGAARQNSSRHFRFAPTTLQGGRVEGRKA